MKLDILVVEDDLLVRESLHEVLVHKGHHVTLATNGEEALNYIDSHSYNVALIDLRLPNMTGIEVLTRAKEKNSQMECIMMTSFATVETAVEAMKMGAIEYITKPINDDELDVLLRRIHEMQTIKEENTFLRSQVDNKKKGFHHMIGENAKMQKIYSIIQAIVDTDTTVLLKGESGTGKGMIAQAIHYSDPSRKDGPYVEISCGAIPRELLESELFGHVKGAFTSAIRDRIGRFELADGGTILLDEIDALPPYLQVKLLRVLQQKTFEMVGDTKTKSTNVRIIASTNRDLEEEIKRGTFREDLYYRLNVISVPVPPLRERRDDIPALVKHFLSMFNEKTKRNVNGITKKAMEMFADYDWPGNVRELENTLERIVVLSQSELIDIEDLPENFHSQRPTTEESQSQSHGSLKAIMKEPEKRVILQALENAGWNRKKAASILNINRTTLYNKMKEHQLL